MSVKNELIGRRGSKWPGVWLPGLKLHNVDRAWRCPRLVGGTTSPRGKTTRWIRLGPRRSRWLRTTGPPRMERRVRRGIVLVCWTCSVCAAAAACMPVPTHCASWTSTRLICCGLERGASDGSIWWAACYQVGPSTKKWAISQYFV